MASPVQCVVALRGPHAIHHCVGCCAISLLDAGSRESSSETVGASECATHCSDACASDRRHGSGGDGRSECSHRGREDFDPSERYRRCGSRGHWDKQIGSIAPGKNADLVVIKGDPSKQVSDIENVEIVFKDGIGYDSQKLLDSVKGRYGEY